MEKIYQDAFAFFKQNPETTVEEVLDAVKKACEDASAKKLPSYQPTRGLEVLNQSTKYVDTTTRQESGTFADEATTGVAMPE